VTESSREEAVNKKTRTLTVSRLYREWGEFYRKRQCIVPSIRLNGKWLTSLGIVPGQKIRVITNGAIISLVPMGSDATGNDLNYAAEHTAAPAAPNLRGREVGQQLSSLNSFSDGLMPRYFGTRLSL
jgi:hypothetical protein